LPVVEREAIKDFSLEAKTERVKAKSGGEGKEGQQPPPHQLGSAWSPDRPKVFQSTIFSTQDGLS